MPVRAELVGGDGYQQPLAMAASTDGRVAVVGNFAGAFSTDTELVSGDGTVDGFLLSYDAQGRLDWSRGLAGPGEDSLTTVAFMGDSIVVGGYVSQSGRLAGTPIESSAQGAALVARFDRHGELELQRTFGGTGFQAVRRVSVTSTGRVLLLGEFGATIQVGEDALAAIGTSDVFVTALDAAGEIAWARTVASPGSDVPHSIAALENGTVIVSGTSDRLSTPAEGTATAKTFLRAFSTDGQPLWSVDRAFHDSAGSATHAGHGGMIERPELLAVGNAGDVILGVTQGQQFGLHGEDFEAAHLGSAMFTSFDAEGRARWHTMLDGGSSVLDLAANAGDQPLQQLVGSFTGSLAIGGELMQGPGPRELFLVSMNERGELGSPLHVDLRATQLPEAVVYSAGLTAVAATTTSLGTTWVAASVGYGGAERDLLLLEF